MGLKKRMRLAREALLAQTAAYEKDHGIRDFEFGTKEQREEAGPIRAGFHRLAQDEMIAGRLIQKNVPQVSGCITENACSPTGRKKMNPGFLSYLYI